MANTPQPCFAGVDKDHYEGWLYKCNMVLLARSQFSSH